MDPLVVSVIGATGGCTPDVSAQGDVIILLLLFHNKESRLKMDVGQCAHSHTQRTASVLRVARGRKSQSHFGDNSRLTAGYG
jgi:hypothetical protein